MQTFYGFRLRALVAGTLVTASLICTVFALSKGQAQTKCNAKKDGAYDDCCRQHNNCVTDAAGSWLKPCAEYASGVYDACMRKYGYSETNPSGPPTNIAGGYPTPPPRPTGLRPPTTVGNNPGPGSTPTKTKPVHPISGPVTNKGPVSSPTPTPQTLFAKPKSTPSPRPEHHRGHHG